MTVDPEQPEVSVVIPTRDRPQWLPRAVASATGQTEVRIEVIVVDDGSQGPVAVDAPGVRVLRHERPLGVAAARNAGVAAAGAEWVAFLDDDDRWAPGKLRRQLDAARAAGAAFAFASGFHIDADGRVLQVVTAPPAGPGLHRAMLTENAIPFACSNLIARTDLVRGLGGFDVELGHLADWDLGLRLSAHAAAVALPDRLVAYTLHGANMQTDERILEAERDRFARKHAEAGIALDEASWLRWRASARRLGGDRRGTALAYWRLGRSGGGPAMLVRAAVLTVAGEPAMRLVARARRSPRPPEPPDWVRR